MGKMTYIWRIASECPEKLIALHDKTKLDPTSFRKALLLKDENFEFQYSGPLADFQFESYVPNSAALPLVSVEVTESLLKLKGIQVQILPAVLNCSDGQRELCLLNPLLAIKAVDRALSKTVVLPGTNQIMKFNRLQLIDEALNGIHLARLEEYRPFILASEQVRELFSSSTLCEFVLDSSIVP